MAAGLFGRKVLHGSHHLARGREGNLIGDPGNTEVGNFDATLGGDEHVARLDVAVDQPGGVSGLQRCGRLADNVENSVSGERFLAFDD